ncbi:DTW domain-containing protein 2-like [Papaver somniferum]|uniref:DTW domain-containing protein 2-like n=1 Tax=Papaver somniferum TaxID=3469 RepID=UPI000E6FCE40|nr:DTW domain-containing protein 2-like [Papaver somniferum]
MEEETELLKSFEFEEPKSADDVEKIEEKGKRDICRNGCDRPANVCLCKELPGKPFLTYTKIIILHHPHEVHHKLATVPILTKSLQNCEILIGRRLRSGRSPILDSLHEASVRDPALPHKAIYLFPGTDSSPAIDLNDWVGSTIGGGGLDGAEIRALIVFDGTWKHAKEMVKSSLPYLSKFATRVCLKYDVEVDGETIFNSELVLRKEPFSGCMSTIEAVARSLKVLEENNNGIEIEGKLISILKSMVKFQSSHVMKKNIKPRPMLKKQNKKPQNIVS